MNERPREGVRSGRGRKASSVDHTGWGGGGSMCETRERERKRRRRRRREGQLLLDEPGGSENTDEDIKVKICGERGPLGNSTCRYRGEKSTLSSEQEVSSKCQPGKSTERLRQAGGQAT